MAVGLRHAGIRAVSPSDTAYSISLRAGVVNWSGGKLARRQDGEGSALVFCTSVPVSPWLDDDQGSVVPATEKLVNMFEAHTAVICRGKAGKSTEFGRTRYTRMLDGLFES